MADPSTPSSAYATMLPTWRTIDDILSGPKHVREQAEVYLPRYPAEQKVEYLRRLHAAPWRPEFDDALRALASKPFSKDVALAEGAPVRFMDLAEDIDARGNNLTAFCRPVFRNGIAKGMHAILVDYPTMAPNATLADERTAGARPYWVSVAAEDILALYTDFRGGREIVTHVRIRETVVTRNGFEEVEATRVRVMEPGLWQVWEPAVDSGEWRMTSDGRMTLPEVPLALFYTGEKKGPQLVKPPLDALADMQIELYRKLSRQDEIETYAGSPMLQAQGLEFEDGQASVEVGPKRILAAPAGIDGSKTGWSYIEPSAENLREVRESVRDVIQDMRRLGMQPMVRDSGDVTATASSIEAAKAHSAVEAWAIALKDVVEQAFVFTAQWLGLPDEVEVEVDTDFLVDPFAQPALDALAKAREARDISHRTYLAGLRRFGVLPPDADIEDEVESVRDETTDLIDEEEELAAIPGAKAA